MFTIIQGDQLPDTSESLPTSQAIRAGDYVFLSAQFSVDEHGQIVSGTIEIDERATRGIVNVLAGVFFQMGTLDANALRNFANRKLKVSFGSERAIVLRYLIVLGHVRVVIALAIPLRTPGDGAIQCQSDQHRKFVCPTIDDRQRAGLPQTDRTDA